MTHPSAEDNKKIEETELHDDLLIDLINQNDIKKKTLLKSKQGVSEDANNKITSNLKNAIKQQNSNNQINNRSNSLTQDLKHAAERAREKKQVLD